jgi:hypothetical protein
MNFDELLEQSIYRISLRLSDAESEFLAIAGETLSKIYGLSNEQVKNYLWDGGYLGDMSSDINKVKRILQQAHENNLQDMVNLYDDITDTVYQEGTSIAVEKGQHLLPFDVFKASFNPMLNDVMKHYETMANSTTVNEGYRDTIKHFVNRLTLDDDRINGPTALRKAVRELSEQGISVVEFESGRKMRMDSAVRTSLMGEYTQIVQGVERRLAEDLNSDSVEISAHIAPAVDHAEIQGQVFLNEEFEKLQNGELATDIDGGKHQTDRAIGQFNCKHVWFPFFLGISERAYDPERLDDILERNEDGVEFHGKHYSLYEATQLQRSIETETRYEREHNNLLKQVRGTSAELEHDYRKSKARLAELQNEYKALGKVLAPKAIRTKWDRVSVAKDEHGNVPMVLVGSLSDRQIRERAEIAGMMARKAYPNETWVKADDIRSSFKFFPLPKDMENIFIAESRLPTNEEQEKDLRKEIVQSKVFTDIGNTVYLIPEIKKYKKTSIDSFLNGWLTELKTIEGQSRQVKARFRDAAIRKGAENVYLKIDNPAITKDEAIKKIRTVLSNNPKYSGRIIVHFTSIGKTYFWHTDDLR